MKGVNGAEPADALSPRAAAMAALVEPVSGDVVTKVEEATIAAHLEGLSKGMDDGIARSAVSLPALDCLLWQENPPSSFKAVKCCMLPLLFASLVQQYPRCLLTRGFS